MAFEISFVPNVSQYEFKKMLLEYGYAERIVFYKNGAVRTIPWTINRLDINSNLIANIRSYQEFRYGNINKVIIKIPGYKDQLQTYNNDNNEQNSRLKNKKLLFDYKNYKVTDDDFDNFTKNEQETFDLLIFGTKLKKCTEYLDSNFAEALDECLKLYCKSVESEKDFTGKAIKKISKWARSPNQNNHKVIKAYFMAYDEFDEPPTIAMMQEICSNECDERFYVQNFMSTYASLKIDNITSNGKVFEDDGEHVEIWEPVRNELLKWKDKFIGN